MAQINNIIPFIRKWEGGYSNNPLDSGGATMWGVTLAVYTAYRKAKGIATTTVADLKNITVAEFAEILKANYWDKWQADKINSQAVANLLVNWAWGSGATTSIKAFQKGAGLTQDGIVGAQTLAYINAQNEIDLFNKIWTMRKDFFVNIVKSKPTQVIFLAGWLNRLYDNVLYNFNLIKK
ncbi:MAG: peptidoglycan-binding protein [Dysgonamonadaceae bacterium]|jgi:lysozyme family protein|nr:peptidoglycan-binding protein [Dysgonamonadaceae bacterium]